MIIVFIEKEYLGGGGEVVSKLSPLRDYSFLVFFGVIIIIIFLILSANGYHRPWSPWRPSDISFWSQDCASSDSLLALSY